jgi:hypothetical protein
VTSCHAADSPDGMRELKERRPLILLSPVIVVILGHATARVAGQLWRRGSWVPVMLVCWVTLAIIGLTREGGWVSRREDERSPR